MCINWNNHDWQKIGDERIPAHGSYYTNMPADPTGTVEYEIFRCSHCGRDPPQERLYSYRANEPKTQRKQKSRYDPTGLRHKPSNV